MRYDTEYYYAPRFVFTSCNQYGSRFKKIPSKKINVLKLSCARDNAPDLEDLILLGHKLDVPVHYDFDTSRAYIRIMSRERVMEL